MGAASGDLQVSQLVQSVLRSAARTSLGPALESEVREFLKNGHDLPLILLAASRACERSVVGHAYPYELLGDPLALLKLDSLDTPEVADLHLHSGASSSLAGWISLSAGGPVDGSLASRIAIDQEGNRFAPGVLICGVRHHLAVAADSRSVGEGRTYRDFAEEIAAGSFWRTVRYVSDQYSTGEPSLDAQVTWQRLAAWGEPVGLRPRAAIQKLVDDVDPFDQGGYRAVLGLVSAVFLLTHFLSSDPGEGLPSFVDRFARTSELRKYLRLSSSRAGEDPAGLEDFAIEMIASGTDRVLPDRAVVGAELRKTITGGANATVGQLTQDVLSDLRQHVEAFRRSRAVASAPRHLAMPATFLRLGRKSSDGFRYDLKMQWRLCHAIVEATSRAEVEEAIAGIDVVGNELAQPNWVFVPILRELKSLRPHLTIMCHAGESFLWPLQGIRSVGELVIPNVVVDRIGHALALDPLIGDLIVGDELPVPTRIAAIEDLCWLVVAGVMEVEARTLLQNVCIEAGLSTLRVGPDALVEAWLDRRDFAGFRTRLGVVGPHAHPDPMPMLRGMSAAPPSLIAFWCLTHATQAPSLDLPLSSRLARDFHDLAEAARGDAASKVTKAIADHGVVLEGCPTSNMRLAGIPRAKYLPYKSWVEDHELRVTINSDDPLIFGANVRDELRIVSRAFTSSIANRLAATSVEEAKRSVRPRGVDDFRRLADELGRVDSAEPVGRHAGAPGRSRVQPRSTDASG